MNTDTLRFIGTFDELVQMIMNRYDVEKQIAERAVALTILTQQSSEEEQSQLNSTFDFISLERKAAAPILKTRYVLDTSDMFLTIVFHVAWFILTSGMKHSIDVTALISFLKAIDSRKTIVSRNNCCPYFRALDLSLKTDNIPFKAEEILPDDKYHECMYVGEIHSKRWRCDKYQKEKCQADIGFFREQLDKLEEMKVLHKDEAKQTYTFTK